MKFHFNICLPKADCSGENTQFLVPRKVAKIAANHKFLTFSQKKAI